MSHRVTKAGVTLLLTVLGSLVAGGVASAQQDPLKVEYREQDGAPGRLQVTVSMSGSAWDPGQRLGKENFTAWINGRQVPARGAAPLQEQQGTRGKLAVVLVIDTSASMEEGGKIARAKAAADRFASAMRAGDQLGLVAF